MPKKTGSLGVDKRKYFYSGMPDENRPTALEGKMKKSKTKGGKGGGKGGKGDKGGKGC